MGHTPAAAAALRPDTERGPIVAAGIVLLTTFVVMTEVRFGDQWSTGVHFVLAMLSWLLAYGIATLTPPEAGVVSVADDPATPEIDSARAWPAPRAWHSAVIVSALVLFFFTVGNLADILGADQPFDAAGTVMWMALLFAFVAFVPANFQWSGIAGLAVAVALGIAWLAFVEEVFEPDGAGTFRWMLLLLILVYAALTVRLRDERPRHSVHMVNAAGLALIALIASFVIDAAFGAFSALGSGDAPDQVGAGWGWEVVMLLFSFGLIAYSAITREPGPAYLGFLALLAASVIVGLPEEEGEGNLIGWPIVVLLGAGAALAAGLSGRRPAMPNIGGGGLGGGGAGAAPPPAPEAPPRADSYTEPSPPAPPASGPPAGQAPPPSAIPPTGDEPTQEMGSLDEPPPPDAPPPGAPPPPDEPPPGRPPPS